MLLKRNNKASSVVEYAVLIVLFLVAIVAMNKQIKGAFMGRWKTLSDSFLGAEQVNPETVECMRYVPFNKNVNSGEGGWDAEIWYYKPAFDCCMDTHKKHCPPSAVGPFGKLVLAVCRNQEDMKGKKSCCADLCQEPDLCNF